jgi:hypothetical protein
VTITEPDVFQNITVQNFHGTFIRRAQLQKMVTTTDAAKTEKIMSEIMKMKKLDVKVLQEAASR